MKTFTSHSVTHGLNKHCYAAGSVFNAENTGTVWWKKMGEGAWEWQGFLREAVTEGVN